MNDKNQTNEEILEVLDPEDEIPADEMPAAEIPDESSDDDPETPPTETDSQDDPDLDALDDPDGSDLTDEPDPPGEPEPSAPPGRPTSALADLEAFGDPDMAVEDGEDDGRAWYVVHCYSSYENKVRHNLEQRIESMGMKDKIFDVVVPVEEEIEVRDGRRRTIERRVFPGYILVYMILTEESWYVVRNTPGVTGFVGQGNTPIPLRPEEVAHIVKRMEAETPRIKVTFKSGERVRIIDGPFNDFRGTVSEIDMERAKVRVMVNFFGRETPVELDFLQVEKA